MSQALDYARPIKRPPSRWLAFCAHLAAAYPLLVLGSLYSQWLLSWWVLGRRPQPSLDDPKYIDGASWMHLITYFALMGFVPAGCGAAALNSLYVVNHRLRGYRLVMLIAILVTLWLGMFILLRWDPGLVLYWWLD